VFEFQHHTQLQSKWSISLFFLSFLNVTPILLVKRDFLFLFFFFLNATFPREILDLISPVHLVSFVYQANLAFTSTVFFIYHNGGLQMLITLVFSTFISIPQRLPTSISLSVMPCSTISSIASHKMLSAYFTVQIICSTLKSQNLSAASLVWYLQYKMNRTNDKQHPCLSPLLAFTLFLLDPVVP